MSEQERSLKDQIWEFTKDISIKVSRKAEKHWKINTLRVEIASIKHRINVKYKELGRFVYESHKSDTLAEESFAASTAEIYEELKTLEADIVDREVRIEELEREVRETAEAEAAETAAAEPTSVQYPDVPPPPPETPTTATDTPPKPEGETPSEAAPQPQVDRNSTTDTAKS